MKNFCFSLGFLLVATSFAQRAVQVFGSIKQEPGEISPAKAIDLAVKLIDSVGGGPIDRKRITYFETQEAGEPKNHIYNVSYQSQNLEIDAVTGMVKLYTRATEDFVLPTRGNHRPKTVVRPAPAPALLAEAPARSLALATAQRMGLPPHAHLTYFTYHDRNPRPDADARGYFAIRYQGSGRSLLHLVFDLRGQMEMLIRIPPHASVPSSGPPLFKHGYPRPGQRG